LLDAVEEDNEEYVFRIGLHIQFSAYYTIKKKHPTDSTQRRRAWCEWYLTNHLAPSWSHVAYALYEGGEHDILEELGNKVHYLKGGCGLN